MARCHCSCEDGGSWLLGFLLLVLLLMACL